MPLRALAPQASASANFATSALRYFFTGPGVDGSGRLWLGADWLGGVTGTGSDFGADGAVAGAVSSTLEPKPDILVAMIESVIDVSMKTIADTVVALESRVADPRGPNAVCEPIPPNAPARSAAFPLCSKTTTIKKTQTTI
jgi:hypothetical protein